MELQDLKQAWNEQPGELPAIVHLPLELQKARQPLFALRQNMRREFYFQVIVMVVVGFLPGLFSLNASWLVFYYLLFGMMVAVTAYYFIKFYRFYTKIEDSSLQTAQNLLKIYYEIRLHLEMYKSLNYILYPFVFLMLVMLQKERFYSELRNLEAPNNWPFIIAVSLAIGISVMLLIVFTNQWVNSLYGKYAVQVKQILDELEN